jgi:hypothetical protein
MSNVVATITHGLFWSVATVACAAVYTVTMVPFMWRTRKLGVGLFEKKDRSARKLRLYKIDLVVSYNVNMNLLYRLPEALYPGWRIRPSPLY